MSNFDGVAEELAIRERLADLAGGRILDNSPDDTDIPVDQVGKVRPYIVLSVGVPFPDPSGGRAFGEGEEDVPHIFTMVVGIYAGDRESLNATYQAVVGRLVGWNPNPANATDLATQYAGPGSRKANEVRPAILGKLVALKCIINMASG